MYWISISLWITSSLSFSIPGRRTQSRGNQGNDPYNIDDDVTDTNGLLKYSAGTGTAHRDTKTYTYTKGFCGGHPAKPEPEEDPETGEILNKDEIENWENEVSTCEDLISESNTGFFCATAENGYENGEDEDGSESKKEMEDDRDKYYEQFISLTYDYSAKEIKARDGYILHDIHTDDIPIETKTVTSSQYKDYNDSCGGNVTNLPHQDSPSGGNSGGGGSENPDEDIDNDYEYEEYQYTGTITMINSSKITIKSDDGDQYRYSTDKIYDLLSEEDIEHLTKGCRVSVSIIVFQGEEYIDHFEKHAPHSRYFSDELGALFIYNNIEHVFTCLVTYGIIPKESIRFRAVKKEQLTQKISCSECDSFRLYQFAGLSWIPYGKSILPRK